MTRDELIEKMTLAVKEADLELGHFRQMAIAALSAIESSGITLVPNEPDDKMILHEGMAIGQMSKDGTLRAAHPYEVLRSQWDAMLAASPYRRPE